MDTRDAFCIVFLIMIAGATATPIQTKELTQTIEETRGNEDVPEQTILSIVNQCVLDDGSPGTPSLVEDCNNFDRLGDHLPVIINFRGPAVLICCPDPPPSDEIIFETDEFDVEEEDIEEFEYEYEEVEYDPSGRCSYSVVQGAICLEADQCGAEDMTGEEPPITCGFNAEKKVHKFCCLGKRRDEAPEENRLARLRGSPVGRPRYQCEDYHSRCRRWAALEPDSCSDDRHLSFSFMTIVCMKTCGICKDLGCIDELPRCEEWSRKGFCVELPEVMSTYCRRSCGACGFKSPRNTEIQTAHGRSYTNILEPRFFCGAGAPKNQEDDDGSERSDDFSFSRRKRQTDEDQKELELFHYAIGDEASSRNFLCGSTVINDRFVLIAAHCLESFGEDQGDAKAQQIVIRDRTKYEEMVEVRRTFLHPSYKFPSLYSDIAVLELGRRIQYDFSKYGDTPACLGESSVDLTGKRATSDGYGLTEHGTTSDVALTVNVTIISNEMCNKFLTHNSSRRADLRSNLKKALELGINEELLCTLGIKNETVNIYSGPCQGDSGGPLFVNYGLSEEDDPTGEFSRRTIEGIVSGGLACGKNTPSWYTRVSAYREWILCIIRETQLWNNADRVQKICDRVKGYFPIANIIPDF